MGTSVFSFRFSVLDYAEGPAPRHYTTEAEGGTTYVRSLDAAGRFVASGTIVLDGSEDHAYSDWLTFYETTTSHGVTSFLYKAVRASQSESYAEALGTASGGGGETFTLDYKFVDSDSLAVYVDGVEQTGGGTDYTLSGNNSAPTITTTATFDTGTVTADYDYYRQVRIVPGSVSSAILTRDTSYADQGAHSVTLALEEVTPGGHLA